MYTSGRPAVEARACPGLSDRFLNLCGHTSLPQRLSGPC
jgi:hypothetical protein